MTAHVDVNLSINQGRLEARLTTDLFREFRWSDGAGTFVQTAFPGIFPNLTRWQAEVDQNTVQAGGTAWKTNAVQVAQHMAAPLLQWPATSPAALVSGGTRDVDVVVQVTGPGAVQGAIDVTLSRLEGNVSNIWEVIGVQASSRVLTISLPPKGELLTSPAMVAGTGSAFEGVISQAFVFDHLYTTIGQAQVKGSSNGETTYTTTQPYTSSFQGGAYEASILVIQVIQLELLCVLLDGIRY